MRDVSGRLRTKMEMEIEHRRAPLAGGRLSAKCRNDRRGSDRFEEFASVHHDGVKI
jgi:hypothetical protein